MGIQDMRVVRCDKCGRLQDEVSADYILIQGQITHVWQQRNNPVRTREIRTDLLPKQDILGGEKSERVVTLCRGCFQTMAELED